MIKLNTAEVVENLKSAGVHLDADQVAGLARNNAFPDATKENGRWLIPEENVNNFIDSRKRSVRKKWFAIAGTFTTLLTFLTFSSGLKDTLDLIVTYLLPAIPAISTPVIVNNTDSTTILDMSSVTINTPTPELQWCRVETYSSCLDIFDGRNDTARKRITCIPDGEIVPVLELITNHENSEFKLSSYSNDEPIKVVKVVEDSAAERAGLQEGDIIVSIDDIPIMIENRKLWLAHLDSAQRTRETIAINIIRSDESMTLKTNQYPGLYLGLFDGESTNNVIGFQYSGGTYTWSVGYANAQQIYCSSE